MAERLVRTLVIELMASAFEVALLGGEIDRRRLGGLGFEIAVHTLMRAVVLRRGRSAELHLTTHHALKAESRPTL